MQQHGIHIYPEVFKKSSLLNVFPSGIVRELKKSTSMDFGQDHMSTAIPDSDGHQRLEHEHHGGRQQGRQPQDEPALARSDRRRLLW